LSRIAPLNELRFGRLPPDDLSDFKRPVKGWLCGNGDLTPKQLKSIFEPLRHIARHNP
jgi:hypothetical protein